MFWVCKCWTLEMRFIKCDWSTCLVFFFNIARKTEEMTEFWTLQSDFILLRETSSLEPNLKIISEKFLSELFRPREEKLGWHIHCLSSVWSGSMKSWHLLLLPFPWWMEWNKTALNQRQFRLDITKNFLATRIVIQRNSSKGKLGMFFMVIKKKKRKERERKEEKKERKKRESFPQFSQLKLSSLLCKYFYWCHFHCIGCHFTLCLIHLSCQERLLQFWPHNLETIAKEAENQLNGTRSCGSRGCWSPTCGEI